MFVSSCGLIQSYRPILHGLFLLCLHILLPLAQLPIPHLFLYRYEAGQTGRDNLSPHQNSSKLPNIILTPIMSQCSQTMCRGGLTCCKFDVTLQTPYCLTQTYCNPNSSTTGFVIILVIMVLATIGVAVIMYLRWRSLTKDNFTMASFVDRQIRYEPQDVHERYSNTKFKTLVSME